MFGSFLPAIIGLERMKHFLPIKRFIDAGITVAGSPDSPVEMTNLMSAIRAAVFRDEETNWDERISLDQTLRNEHKKGLIKEGYVADIPVFEDDLFAVDLKSVLERKVAATVVREEIAFRKKL
jgi:predicted amidohydrolase YtcJ